MSSVADADVNLNVNLRGTGDAPAKLDQTTKGIKATETAAKSSTMQFVSLRGSISQVAQVASSAAGEMTRDLGAVVGLVGDASSKFGDLGFAVTGVVAVVGALDLAFEAIKKARFENTTKSLQELANTAGSLARGLANAASNARELQGVLKTAEVRTLTAQIAEANARGDKVAAAGFTARLAAVTSTNEAGSLRSQAGGALQSGADALTVRTAATNLLQKTEERIKFLEQAVDDRAFAYHKATGAAGYGAIANQDVARVELAGLQDSRIKQVGALAMLSPDSFAQNNAAATALLKAADAVEKEGLTTQAVTLVNAATEAFKAAAGKAPKGGSRGGGDGLTRGGKLSDDEQAAHDRANLLRALQGSGQDTGIVGIIGQGIIDEALARSKDKGIRLDPGAGSMADVSVTAANDNARQIDSVGALATQFSNIDKAQPGAVIRDFSAALAAAIPDMGDFAGALNEISNQWATYAELQANAGEDVAKQAAAQKALATATIGSLGAIAKAGASRIKDERLRAGVLSIIELGVGTGMMLTPGMQAEGAAHLAAAAILGSVAIFGGAGGSKSHAATSSGDRAFKPMNDNAVGGALVVNINAPWFGPSPQEAAAGLAAFLGLAAGTGFSAAA